MPNGVAKFANTDANHQLICESSVIYKDVISDLVMPKGKSREHSVKLPKVTIGANSIFPANGCSKSVLDEGHNDFQQVSFFVVKAVAIYFKLNRCPNCYVLCR